MSQVVVGGFTLVEPALGHRVLAVVAVALIVVRTALSSFTATAGRERAVAVHIPDLTGLRVSLGINIGRLVGRPEFVVTHVLRAYTGDGVQFVTQRTTTGIVDGGIVRRCYCPNSLGNEQNSDKQRRCCLRNSSVFHMYLYQFSKITPSFSQLSTLNSQLSLLHRPRARYFQNHGIIYYVYYRVLYDATLPRCTLGVLSQPSLSQLSFSHSLILSFSQPSLPHSF